MDIEKLSHTLKKFVTKHRGIQDAVLISSEAELITNPMGEWDEESITTMAVQMLYLTGTTREHLGWSFLEQMWLQAKDNYFIGIRCDNQVFLLVKAIQAGPLGGLRITINSTVKELQKLLNSEAPFYSGEISPDSHNGEPSNLEAIEGEEVMWRGRKLR